MVEVYLSIPGWGMEEEDQGIKVMAFDPGKGSKETRVYVGMHAAI